MESRMDEFRDFVSRYPKVRDDVRNGKRTWQNIYEEWVLYGEGDAQWEQYRANSNSNSNMNNNTNTSQNQSSNNSSKSTGNASLTDSLKTIYGYVQKINPDSLNRTLNTVQKVIQIAQTVGSKGSVPTSFINNAYNDWWD